jgi:hypothetical protein
VDLVEIDRVRAEAFQPGALIVERMDRALRKRENHLVAITASPGGDFKLESASASACSEESEPWVSAVSNQLIQLFRAAATVSVTTF